MTAQFKFFIIKYEIARIFLLLKKLNHLIYVKSCLLGILNLQTRKIERWFRLCILFLANRLFSCNRCFLIRHTVKFGIQFILYCYIQDFKIDSLFKILVIVCYKSLSNFNSGLNAFVCCNLL